MTTDQAIALAFPLLGVAALLVTGVLIVKPWKSKRTKRAPVGEAVATAPGYPDRQSDLDQDLAEADRLINRVRGRIATN